MTLSSRARLRYELAPDEVAATHEGIADLDHGRSAGEDEMRAFWKRCGAP
jgi:hypothetical protein